MGNINRQNIDVDLRGMGGGEKKIAKLFPNLERVSESLYDFIDPKTGEKIEVKKTANEKLQCWIDPTKYTDLTDEERQITFRFIYYDKEDGKFIDCVDFTLGEVIDKIPEEILFYAKKIAEAFPKRSEIQFKYNIVMR